MADRNAFAIEFLELLKRSKFPKGVKHKDMLQQHHTIVTALNNRVLAAISADQHSELLAQGLKGGGGPHRLDLVLHFSTDTDKDTLLDSRELIENILGS